MNHKSSLLFLILALSLLTYAGTRQAYAADQVVSNCGDSGLATQLRQKITDAQNSGGGTITFTCGPATIVLQNGVLPTITTNTTINGAGKITISGNNATRIFYVNAGATLTLNNITIRNAYSASSDGGAVFVNNGGALAITASYFYSNTTGSSQGGGAITTYGALNISGSEFAYNKAGGGGAINTVYGGATTTISNTNFHDNQTLSGSGGAIYIRDAAPMTLTQVTLTNNKALSLGGGIVVAGVGSSLTISNSEILSNTALLSGGGIFNSGTANLTNVTLNRNSAPEGGGIFNDLSATTTITNVTLVGNTATDGGAIGNNGTANLTNVTFSGNSASNVGGGISHYQATSTLTNVTFIGNSAAYGGGIAGNYATLNLKNTLLAKGTSGANCNNAFGGTFNLSDDNSCGFGVGRDNVTNLNLGPLANNGGFTKTHLPGAGSAAIDNGTGSGAPGSDQRSIPRPQGVAVDVGAVEVCQKPGMPNFIALANNATTRPTLKWNGVPCAAFYKVRVKDAATGLTVDKAKVNAVIGVTVYKYKTDPLPTNTRLKWFVKACNGTFGCAKSAAQYFTIQ